ncbi:MAG TPA: hypothetical protein PLL66_04325 [Bacteroidales bacterium]|nr:hypothetical protein [Bacteroidales bacterium]
MHKTFLSIISIALNISIFASNVDLNISISEYNYYPIRKKDSIKSEIIYNIKKMGNEIKLSLNKEGKVGYIINENQVITIKNDGFTGFGTDNPQHRLDVCGTIRASEELIVEASEWCDFVFEKGYIKEPFKERMTSIKTQKHLPYIRPQEDILESGISVSETISGLLRNIEELYLYIEELEKRIDNLESENARLNSLINEE